MTLWQEYARVGIIIGIGVFLWAMMNLPFTKTEIRNWIRKVKTEILPEQKRQRKEIYSKITMKLYPEYYELKRKGEIP
jgi:hypothetical protein